MRSARTSDRRFGGLVLPGVAASGVLIGHWLTYVLLDPSAHLREEVLAQTGHGYWNLAVQIGTILGASAFTVVAIRVAGVRSANQSRGGAFGRIFVRLAAVQAIAFSVMEMAERLAGHHAMAALINGGVLPVGIAVQILVAAAGGLVLLWFARTAVRVIALAQQWMSRRRERPTSLRLHCFAIAHGPRFESAGIPLVRGPPFP